MLGNRNYPSMHPSIFWNFGGMFCGLRATNSAIPNKERKESRQEQATTRPSQNTKEVGYEIPLALIKTSQTVSSHIYPLLHFILFRSDLGLNINYKRPMGFAFIIYYSGLN